MDTVTISPLNQETDTFELLNIFRPIWTSSVACVTGKLFSPDLYSPGAIIFCPPNISVQYHHKHIMAVASPRQNKCTI